MVAINNCGGIWVKVKTTVGQHIEFTNAIVQEAKVSFYDFEDNIIVTACALKLTARFAFF